tara:strand:+ start:1671 stop:2153 length:483 start_codon:yes stop_codon:yes gene_type:complete
MKKISNEIADAVLLGAAEQCKATPALVRSKDRRRFIVEARQLVTAILKEGGWGFQAIANFLTEDEVGNHTNPHHWFKMHEISYGQYDYYRISYDQLKSCYNETVDEFVLKKGKVIDIEIYMELKNKYETLKMRHDSVLMESKLMKQTANKLKSQLTQLWK